MSPRLKKLLRHAPALLGVVLLVGAIYVVQREFRNLKLEDIATAVQAIPARALVLAFGWTVLSYGVLTFYDRLGTIYAGHKVSYGRVSFASFCAYALSHNLGFAAVSGAAVRYRLYAHWGLTPIQIAKVVAFCSLTFALGGMVLGGAILFLEPGSIPFFGEHLPHWMLYGVGVLLWAVVGAYVTLARVFGVVRLFGHEVGLPGWRMAIVQVVLATVDVAITASIFYTLLPHAPGLTWLIFLGVYVASYTAGLAANLPGGIGVFDTAMLLGLAPYLDAPVVIGAIVVFRLYYYVIPLFIAGGLFAGNELLLRGTAVLGKVRGPARSEALSRWREPDFAVAAATGVVALSGALLLALGVLAPVPDLTWIDPDFADLATQASQFVPSLIGAGLIVLAIGLSQRVNLAWGATIVLLLVGAAFTAAQGERLWIAGVLVMAVMLLAPFRACFYRHARLFSGPMQLDDAMPLFGLIGCILALAAFERHVRYLSNNSWWEIVLSRHVPNSVRAAVALTVALARLALWGRPAGARRVAALEPRRAGATRGWAPHRRQRRRRGRGARTERAAVPFRRAAGCCWPRRSRRRENDRVSAVWRLRDLAGQEGLDPAIWRAGPTC